MTKIEIRDFVLTRANFCCEYCRSPRNFSSDDFAIEHIMPKSLGGLDEINNLALSCQGCNNRKYVATSAIDPVSGVETLLFNPRTNIWTEHFIWSDDTTTLIGLSRTARATIQKLDLNRSRVQNFRRVLALAGEHPK
jgi:hypothetical protein